jgi:hypothetical protein
MLIGVAAFSRTMRAKLRLVVQVTAFDWPASLRASASAAVRPAIGLPETSRV